MLTLRLENDASLDALDCVGEDGYPVRGYRFHARQAGLHCQSRLLPNSLTRDLR